MTKRKFLFGTHSSWRCVSEGSMPSQSFSSFQWFWGGVYWHNYRSQSITSGNSKQQEAKTVAHIHPQLRVKGNECKHVCNLADFLHCYKVPDPHKKAYNPRTGVGGNYKQIAGTHWPTKLPSVCRSVDNTDDLILWSGGSISRLSLFFSTCHISLWFKSNYLSSECIHYSFSELQYPEERGLPKEIPTWPSLFSHRSSDLFFHIHSFLTWESKLDTIPFIWAADTCFVVVVGSFPL